MDFVEKLIHAVVFGLLITGINLLLQQFDFYNQAGRGKRFGIFSVIAFVVIFLLNLIWPYPS